MTDNKANGAIGSPEGLPRVLVPCINVWQDSSPIRTLTDIFSCWDSDRLAQIYTRAGVPDSSVCSRFFRIDENAVIRSIFRPGTVTGKVMHNLSGELTPEEQQALDAESRRYSEGNKHRRWFMSLAREAVWLFGRWKTPELDKFIEDFDPELIFATVYPVAYMSRIQRYIVKKTNKPVVCYIFDDNYTYKTCSGNPLAYIHRHMLRRNVRRLMKHCQSLFVISPKQKEEYDRIFHTDSRILTKAVDFTNLIFEPPRAVLPLKMVYTGKLVIGRDGALARLCRAVKEVNAGTQKISFEIYSPDKPSDKLLEIMNTGGNHYMGGVSRDKVAAIQKSADIVVFAESLERKYRYQARLSFSTKLTDYFACGKCVLALGDRDIAPIDYLIREDAAVVVTDYSQLTQTLIRLCDDPDTVAQYAKKAFECGQRNHNAVEVLPEFKKELIRCAARSGK